MNAETREKIRAFVAERCQLRTPTDDENIFASGYVNSLFAMELVLFIEKLLEMRIPNHEVLPANFASIDAMTALAGRLSPPVDIREAS